MKQMFILVIIGILPAALALNHFAAQEVNIINVDIGKNINETARHSGAPRYAVSSYWGATFYEIVDLPKEIVIRYARPGYEIAVRPVFALTMFADSETSKDLVVELLRFQLSRHAATSHEGARALVEELNTQFRKGGWKRSIPDTCPAVSGRSTYLDEAGEIGGWCPLDPDYQIPGKDWLELMPMTKYFEWNGDGVVARLEVGFSEWGNGIHYAIDLEFRDMKIEEKRNTAMVASELKEGDEKGWKSTENRAKALAENALANKRLEKMALARGDQLSCELNKLPCAR
jgi:hypothetical protein